MGHDGRVVGLARKKEKERWYEFNATGERREVRETEEREKWAIQLRHRRVLPQNIEERDRERQRETERDSERQRETERGILRPYSQLPSHPLYHRHTNGPSLDRAQNSHPEYSKRIPPAERWTP